MNEMKPHTLPLYGHTPQEIQLWDLFAPTLDELGLRLVKLKIIQRGGQVLDIALEKLDTSNGRIGLDECAQASRRLSRLLDVHDPLESAYNLEVGSPGLERPLMTLEDLESAKEQMVLVKLEIPLDGQRKYAGVLQVVSGDSVTVDGKEFGLAQVKEICLQPEF